jgi:hypothetical protein
VERDKGRNRELGEREREREGGREREREGEGRGEKGGKRERGKIKRRLRKSARKMESPSLQSTVWYTFIWLTVCFCMLMHIKTQHAVFNITVPFSYIAV